MPASAQSAHGSEAAPAAGGRLEWIDMARGFCVIAVVLLHVALFHVFPLTPDDHGRPLARAWVLFNTAVLGSLRMPLLLLLSGFLARRKIREGLRFARTRLAIATNLHLYLVWTLLYFAVGILFYPYVDRAKFETHSWSGLALSLLYPQVGPLWFVYVLSVSLFVLALTRRVPPALVLVGFFAAGWAIMALTRDAAGLPRAIFFAAGALVGEQLIALTRSWIASGLAFVVYVAGAAVAEKIDVVLGYPLEVAAGLCAAVAFLALAQLVAKARWFRVPGAWVGRRTLGVYVLHWPFVAALTWFGVQRPELFRGWLSGQVAEIAYPIAVAALIVILCIGLERLLKAVGLGVLFDLPGSVKRRLVRGAATQAGVAASPPPAPTVRAADAAAPYRRAGVRAD